MESTSFTNVQMQSSSRWLALVTRLTAWECACIALQSLPCCILPGSRCKPSQWDKPMTLEHSTLFCLLWPAHLRVLSLLPTVLLSVNINCLSYLILLLVPPFLLTHVFSAARFLLGKKHTKNSGVTQENGERGSSKGRVLCVCNRRPPVRGRIMSLAFGQLVTLLSCEVSDESDKDHENAKRLLLSVSWVPFFSNKECAKNSPTHTLLLFLYFCNSLL